jgi:uncharacterized protein YaiE (UPF0345 family)
LITGAYRTGNAESAIKNAQYQLSTHEPEQITVKSGNIVTLLSENNFFLKNTLG